MQLRRCGIYDCGKFPLLYSLLKIKLGRKLDFFTIFSLGTLFTRGNCPHFEIYGEGKRLLKIC